MVNSELKKARAHYDTLPPHVKERATAKHLLAVIQIAERHEAALTTIRDVCCGEPQCKQSARLALAAISKPEGQ